MDLFGLAGGLLGALGSGDSKQSQSTTKTPYGPATGWLDSNIADGIALQNYYKQNPFSTAQQNAYGNSLGLSNGFRNVMGGLNKQMSSTQYFDRSNPTARPQSYNFTGGDTSQASSISQPQSVGNGSSIPSNPWASMPVTASAGMPQQAPGYIAPADGSRGYTEASQGIANQPVNNAIQSFGGALQNLGLGTIGQAVSDYGFSKTPNAQMSFADQYQAYREGRITAEQMAKAELEQRQQAVTTGGTGNYGSNYGFDATSMGAPNAASASAIANSFADYMSSIGGNSGDYSGGFSGGYGLSGGGGNDAYGI